MPTAGSPSKDTYTITLDGGQEVFLPRVTSILGVISKPALVNWASKTEREFVKGVSADLYDDLKGTPPMSREGWLTSIDARLGKEKAHQREMAKAQEIGSQAHKLIEWNIRKRLGQVPGPEPRVTDKALWAFMAWETWADSVSFEPILVEQRIYSLKYGYAGTLDLLAKIDGKLMILDWKTGKAIYEESLLQNAAYQVALEEMGHGKAEGGLIVRLPKVETDPEFEVREVPPRDDLFPVFLHAIELYRWQKKNDEAYWAKRNST
jgi:hypothetical protein